MEILTTKNIKTMKGEAFGYDTGLLHLAPFKISGKNVCPNASNGCAKACLFTSGHGRYPRTQNARIARNMLMYNEPEIFHAKIVKDIETIVRRAKKHGTIPAIRMNGTSDLPKLGIKYANLFPDVQFYDYTKNIRTLERKDIPANYHLTFSRSETNEKECLKALSLGFNVAVVFEKMPETYLNHKVVTGEESDLRFLDKYDEPVIIGLTAKGRAKHDTSGFVVRGV